MRKETKQKIREKIYLPLIVACMLSLSPIMSFLGRHTSNISMDNIIGGIFFLLFLIYTVVNILLTFREDEEYDLNNIMQSKNGRIDQYGGFTPNVKDI